MHTLTVFVRSALSSVRHRVLSFFGFAIEFSAEGGTVSWSSPFTERRVWRTVVGGLLGVYAALYVVMLATFPPWGPFSTIDEQLQYYQVGRNYSELGFSATVWLPDLSTASSRSGHPYLYNHQPPGPQLLIGVVLSVFGENYRLVRLVFALLFCAGFACFICLAARLAPAAGYAAVAVVALLPPGTVLHVADHPAKSAFPLAVFFPVVALCRWRESGRRSWLVAAAIVALLSSTYLMYSHVIMAVAFWTAGAALAFLPLRRGELTMLLGVTAAGVVLHLLQTVVFAGWSFFAREFVMTLSNRVAGVPTREELVDFFRAHSFVLYGGHTFELARFKSALLQEFTFPAATAWKTALGVTLLLGLAFETRRRSASAIGVSATWLRWIGEVVRAFAWTGFAVAIPIVFFPAFASDYPLGGTSEFLLGLFVLLSVTATLRFAGTMACPGWVRRVVVVLVVAFMALVVDTQARQVVHAARKVIDWARVLDTENGLVWVGGHLRGQVAMTNVDPTVVGFFTREMAFGGCHRPSLGVAIDPSKCYVNFIRGYPHAVHPVPSVYVWIDRAQAFCRATECVQRSELEQRWVTVFDNGTVAVYDLNKPHSRAVPEHRRPSATSRS
jgi:hypothetical protein